jgi:dTDP-4-dehydrorhamnose reductase
MTSLVIGASGQVGALLNEFATREGDCIGTYCNQFRPGLTRLELRDHTAVARLVQNLRPDVCFLPPAPSFRDDAEDHPNECGTINVPGVTNLALVMAQGTGTLVLFSTGHVFGDDLRPRREDERTEPSNIAARSHAEGERTVRAVLPDQHLILRTSWVYGPDPQRKNFVHRVLETLTNQEVLTVPAGQHGQPTYGPDLARTALELVRRGAKGIYHVVGPQYLSRLAWAREIAEGLDLPAHRIQEQPASALRLWAPRPFRVRLDRQKLLLLLGRDPIRPPREGILGLVSPAQGTGFLPLRPGKTSPWRGRPRAEDAEH